MRTVTITVNASKFTGRVFAKAVAKVYEHIKNGKIAKQQEKEPDVTPHGKQSVKELVSQGQGVTSIEVHDRGIRRFERVARKYGVDYAIKQVKGENKYLVFFKGRDTDALQAALAEYTQQQVNRSKRPSVRKLLNRIKARQASRPRTPEQQQNRSQTR